VIRNGAMIHKGTPISSVMNEQLLTPVWPGSFDTLRHLKKDIAEARKGSECGLSLATFKDLKEGDLIQVYHNIELPGMLQP
jgi:translation initiation factor IF-2